MFEERKKRKQIQGYFDRQLNRLEERLDKLEVGSEEYDRVLLEIDKILSHQAVHKEVHRKIDKDVKKPIIGAMCLGGLMLGNYIAASRGVILTGQERKNGENLLSTAISNFSRTKMI